MTPEKHLVVDYLIRQGWDAEVKDGIVIVYDAPFNVIRDEVRGIGYKSSFGVSHRNQWPGE